MQYFDFSQLYTDDISFVELTYKYGLYIVFKVYDVAIFYNRYHTLKYVSVSKVDIKILINVLWHGGRINETETSSHTSVI